MKKTLFILLSAAWLTTVHAEDYTFTERNTNLTGTISGYENVLTAGVPTSSWNGAVGQIKNNIEFSITGNENITLSGCSTNNKGGVFYVNQSSYASPQTYTTFNLSGNTGEITISDNYATSQGGAIAADANTYYYSIVNIEANTGTLTFQGNNTDGNGGAIWTNGVLNINNNNQVTFQGNAVNKANGNWGGAIYLGGSSAHNVLSICGNSYVEFRGNYLLRPQSTYVPEATVTLNSIYQKYTNSANNISAQTGGQIIFYDSFKTADAGAKASYELNADYADANGVTQKAGGSIVFSGKYVETDLQTFTEATGDVTASLTSTLVADTTLHNGTLSIEDNAILETKNLTVKSEAILSLSNGTCATLDGGSLVFNGNSKISVTGSNTLSSQSIEFSDNAIFSMVVTEVNRDEALMNVITSNISYGKGTVNFEGVENLSEGQYLILDLTGSELTNMEWSTEGIEITGVGSDDYFSWNDAGTQLYLNHVLIPEPTTASLSLLALVTLVMHRRRD